MLDILFVSQVLAPLPDLSTRTDARLCVRFQGVPSSEPGRAGDGPGSEHGVPARSKPGHSPGTLDRTKPGGSHGARTAPARTKPRCPHRDRTAPARTKPT